MIGLWVLALLVILALSLGNRTFLNLKIARYQKDSLKARCLAFAGVQKAISELEKDTNGFDSLDEQWSTGLDSMGRLIFENVEVVDGSGDSFIVKYLYDKNAQRYLCMEDEQRKINLNSASLEFLSAVIKMRDAEVDAQALAAYLCAWRGDENPKLLSLAGSLKDVKRAPFSVPEELIAALESFFGAGSNGNEKAQEAYARLKDVITVYPALGQAKININTVNPEILEMVTAFCISRLVSSGTESNIQAAQVSREIIGHRNLSPFTSSDLASVLAISGPGESEIKAILNELREYIGVSSQHFRIRVTGKANNGLTRVIECIYDRDNGNFVYWRQI